jgi:hypothetical protein
MWAKNSFATASFPLNSLRVHVPRLVRAGHRVGSVRQMETHPTIMQKVAILQKSNPDAGWWDVVELKGTYSRPPTTADILLLRWFQWPWYLMEFVYFHARWHYKFTLNKHEYGDHEKEVLTAEAVDCPWERWVHIKPEQKQEFMDRDLYKPGKLAEYKQDRRREMRKTGKRTAGRRHRH